jgi:hypothetical protein
VKYVQEPRKWTDSLARPKHRKRDMRFGTWNAGGCRLDPVGSGEGPVADFCEYGDEPSGSGATALVS